MSNKTDLREAFVLDAQIKRQEAIDASVLDARDAVDALEEIMIRFLIETETDSFEGLRSNARALIDAGAEILTLISPPEQDD